MNETHKVWVLTIEHRHGTDITVYRTREGAEAALLDYVIQYWDQEMRDRGGEISARPEDPQESIDEYFFGTDDEDYFITDTLLLP